LDSDRVSEYSKLLGNPIIGYGRRGFPCDPGYKRLEALMIRQAHTYLAGAISGTALIAAAIVAFVMLVSFQALRDWPFGGLIGNDGDAAVSSGRPATGGAGEAASGTAPRAPIAPTGNRAGPAASRADRARAVKATVGAAAPSPAPGNSTTTSPSPGSTPAA